jgi:microcystin degradation protein MlrC
VDGVLLSLHGAATVEDVDDPEGEILNRIREIVGEGVPIVASLDLHAHVTELMVRQADALVAFETYPHRDAFSTGQRAARLLFDVIEEKVRPVMALAKVPVIVSAINGHTDGAGPFADVMRFAKSHEGIDGVLSVSPLLVHPYLDLPDMGGGALVITDGDERGARTLAEKIAERYWERRAELEPKTYDVTDAIHRGIEIPGGPVLLVDTSDCCGGGAAGDSVHVLKALLDAHLEQPCHVPVVDSEAAAICHRLGVGADVTLTLGHKIDQKWGQPIIVHGRVLHVSDGYFTYCGGPWAGLLKTMGPTAVLEIGPVRVMINSYPTYDWADEQFQSVGLNAAQAKFVVVKNPMNYRSTYGGLAVEALVLNTPGPTPPTLRHVRFQGLKRPYFPADAEIQNLKPTVYVRSTKLCVSTLPS